MFFYVSSDGSKEPEIIINPKENFTEKMRYYDQAYNDDMELISAKKAGKLIRIINISMMNYLVELVWLEVKRIDLSN